VPRDSPAGWYGVDDLRPAFLSEGVDRMTGEERQAMMQHADCATTQRDIGMARRLKATAERVYVPERLSQ
jgi:hypothetical protein